MQSQPNHLDLQVVKTMLESMLYEVGEVRGPRGDRWLSIRICEGAFPLEPPDRYTAFIRAGEDNYLSIHVNLGKLNLDQPSGAWLSGQVPEMNYRNDVARVGIERATGAIVIMVDMFLADLRPTPAFLARNIKALESYARSVEELMEASKVEVEDEGESQ